MHKQILLLAALLAAPSIALSGEHDDHASVGRYQLAFSIDGLYFLDTATGELWMRTGQGGWDSVRSPIHLPKHQRSRSREQVTLTLPKRGKKITMMQREKRAIPGSDDSLWIQLGDITGGQVMLEVVDANGQSIVERTSMKRRDFVKFKVDKRDIYLQIADLEMHLLSADFCELHLSKKKPKKEPATTRSDETVDISTAEVQPPLSQQERVTDEF
ncbi:MAG: hypothetical protein HKN47_25655 [Pirellulaceae bacterium]|nr:hypothetical protein [Pirellulaceae bacterium]